MVQNCWELKNCGRELRGKNSHLGVCPAYSEKNIMALIVELIVVDCAGLFLALFVKVKYKDLMPKKD